MGGERPIMHFLLIFLLFSFVAFDATILDRRNKPLVFLLLVHQGLVLFLSHKKPCRRPRVERGREEGELYGFFFTTDVYTHCNFKGRSFLAV